MLAEARAGIRRWPDTDIGEHYQDVVAHRGEGQYNLPGVVARTLGDLVMPLRPLRVVDVVNAVSKEVGADVAGWRVSRVWALYAQLEREAEERDGPRPADL